MWASRFVMLFSSMAMMIAFLIGKESSATTDEMLEEEEYSCLLNSWKNFTISSCWEFMRCRDFEREREDEEGGFGLGILKCRVREDERERERCFDKCKE